MTTNIYLYRELALLSNVCVAALVASCSSNISRQTELPAIPLTGCQSAWLCDITS